MAFLKTVPLYTMLALVAACSQLGIKSPPPATTASPAQTSAAAVAEPEPAVDPAAEAAARAQAALPKQPLTPDILFKFLIAEVAGQRGQIGVAQSTYLDLARETHDPRIARRAAEVSMFARDPTGAQEATTLWMAAEPDSEPAQQTMAVLLLNEGRLIEAEPILRTLLKREPANGFVHLGAVLGKVRGSPAWLELVERLAADYPALPEARFAVAQAAASIGRNEAAIAALQKANALRPGWEPAALLHAQILDQTSHADSLAFMRKFLAAHAEAREVRLARSEEHT